MISKVIRLICTDCGASLNLNADTQDDAFTYARKNDWAVSRDRKACYCPQCAPHRRHVGKYGTRRAVVQERFKSV